MVTKKYRVTLTQEERATLKGLVSSGKAAARKITHARILLLLDENAEAGKHTDATIIKVLQVGDTTVARAGTHAFFMDFLLNAIVAHRP